MLSNRQDGRVFGVHRAGQTIRRNEPSSGRRLRYLIRTAGEPKPCHVVCELHRASVPVALILSPAVAQVLDGVVWQAQVSAASQHLHRYGLVDRLKSTRRVPHHILRQVAIEIGEPSVIAEPDEPGMVEGVGEHAQLPDIINHGRGFALDECRDEGRRADRDTDARDYMLG